MTNVIFVTCLGDLAIKKIKGGRDLPSVLVRTDTQVPNNPVRVFIYDSIKSGIMETPVYVERNYVEISSDDMPEID